MPAHSSRHGTLSERASGHFDRSSSGERSPTTAESETSPALSTSADLPPSTALRNRGGGVARAESGRWRTVRPWKPPASADDSPSGSASRSPTDDAEDEGALSLEVIDVSSTAIALGIFGLQSQSEDATTPNISIRLNQSPWPHVFHSPGSGDDDSPNDRETVVVYGLDPGREYEVELAIVGIGGSAGIPFTTPAASHDSATGEAEAEPEDAPPPYTPTPVPAQPDSAPQAPAPTEASLRAQIKKLRSDAKASETALQNSISSLQRAIERTAKDDQKAKQRLIALDDGARKLREAAARDQANADAALSELPQIERAASERQQQATTRRTEVQQKEKEVLEQVRLDEETIAGLSRRLEELKERTEGVKQESDRYEQEVIDDLTARLAHLDQQLQSGEISPSFLASAPGLVGNRPVLKTSAGAVKGRDRKGSNAALKNPHAGKTTPPSTSVTQPRIIPGWKNPNASASDRPVAVVTAAPITPPPPLMSNPAHGPIGPPNVSPREEKSEEKAGWRFGTIGEQLAKQS